MNAQESEMTLEEAAERIAGELAVEEEVEESSEEEEVQEDAVETPAEDDEAEIQQAIKDGWKPKDQYKGDPKEWRDYKEFNAKGDRIASKLHAKIDKLTAFNAKQEKMIKQLIKSQGQVAKQARDEAIAQLKVQRREAIQIGDADAVEALDTEIEQVKAAEVDVEVESDKPEIDPYVEQWVQDEKAWFNTANPDMVRYAATVENTERALNPEADVTEIFDLVKKAVTARFPGRVPSSKPVPPKKKQLPHNMVEGVGSGGALQHSGGLKFSELPAEARRIAEQFEKQGIMSKKDYLKEYNQGLV